MKRLLLLPLIATCLTLAGCQEPGTGGGTNAEVSDASLASSTVPRTADEDEGDDDDETEEEIPLSEVPQSVKDAAIAAVPGLVLEEAEVEDGVTVYDLEGEVAGEEVTVEVTAAGEVLEVEWDDDEDEDEDDEEEEDED